jgi:cytochrome b subunit of formate dehydrogenase
MWRLISLLLGLTGFAITGGMSFLGGVEPLEAVIRGICVFMALWFLFSLMGFMFVRVVPVNTEHTRRQNEMLQEQNVVEHPVNVSDSDLPDLSAFGGS